MSKETQQQIARKAWHQAIAAANVRDYDSDDDAVSIILSAIDALEQQLLSAQAAIEKHNKQYENCSLAALIGIRRDTGCEPIIDVDLSVLREHDAEAAEKVRKPLVEALKFLREGLDEHWHDDNSERVELANAHRIKLSRLLRDS